MENEALKVLDYLNKKLKFGMKKYRGEGIQNRRPSIIVQLSFQVPCRKISIKVARSISYA
jgi:hypothetical protein